MRCKASGSQIPRNSAKRASGHTAFRVFHSLWSSSWSKTLRLSTVLLLALLPALVAAGSPLRVPFPARLDHQSQPIVDPPQVHPGVWEALQDGGKTEVLVILRAQADLKDAGLLPTKEAKGRYVYEALRSVAQATQRGLRSLLEAQRADYQSFYLVNAIQVRVDGALARSLATRPEVARILPNPRVRGVPDVPLESLVSRAPQGIEANLTRVNADDVWALGYTGQDVVVAGQDTGYDWDHPALKEQYRGWDGATADHDYNWHDAIHRNDPNTAPGNPCGFDSPEPCDDHNHGTHTMGIMVGDDGAGTQIGMAPGARWIGCRNMEQSWGTPATYIECFEFFLAPYPLGGDPLQDGDPSLAPHVVNNSWACPQSEGCDEEHIALMETVVDRLRQAGIVVVASAGNSGYEGCGSVQYPPAIYQQSFSVGNFDHRTDQIYGSSSRGPVIYGGTTYLKPEITAPGVSIRSSTRDGNYAYLSGTSMAAPHVAGAVALLLSFAPGYSGRVDAIEQILAFNAEPMTTTEGCGGDGSDDVPNNTWGWGILDALAAVQAATACTLQGVVTKAAGHAPLADAEVMARLVSGPAGPMAITDPTGQYTLTLAAGIYDLTARAEGYMPQTFTNIVVISGEIQIQDFALEPLLRYLFPLVRRDF
jgi:serine protease AprX